MTTGGTIGGIREYFRESKVKEKYMTLQGIQTHCSQLSSQNPKTVKSHLSLTLMRVKLVYRSFFFIGARFCTFPSTAKWPANIGS